MAEEWGVDTVPQMVSDARDDVKVLIWSVPTPFIKFCRHWTPSPQQKIATKVHIPPTIIYLAVIEEE